MRLLLALALIVATPAMAMTPDERAERFAVGIAHFEADRFDEALRAWALVDIENADLSRDRGVAYERLGDNGRAMLHYLRALRLRPDDGEAKAGADRIADRREDRIVALQPTTLEKGWIGFATSLSLAAWAYLWLGAFWLAGVAGAWLLFEPGRGMKETAKRMTIASIALVVMITLPFGWRVWLFETDATGVVIAAESVATDEPTGGMKRFTLHAGMVGALGEREGGYRRFTAPNGVTGWVKESTVAPVRTSR